MPRIPLLPVAVDDFSWAPGVTLYLLSHLHTDHLAGLSASWRNGLILATPLTRALLLRRMPELARVIRPLPVGDVFRYEAAPGVQIDVLAVDASHCIGACMFLLTGYFGSVLCTGDFRYDAVAIARTPQLQGGFVDDVLLDDTFLDPRFDFPPPAVALQQAVDFVAGWERRLGELGAVLVKVDTWGKEELLVRVAQHLRTLVVVDDERMAMVRVARQHGADLPDIFTTSRDEGRVWAVRYRPREDSLLHLRSEGWEAIGLIPSGWCGTAPRARGRVARIGYSAHSSFGELLRFVEWLRPRACHSTSRGDGGAAVRAHLDPLLRTPGQPESILMRLDYGRLVPRSVLHSLSEVLVRAAPGRRAVVPMRRRPAGAKLAGCATSSQLTPPDQLQRRRQLLPPPDQLRRRPPAGRPEPGAPPPHSPGAASNDSDLLLFDDDGPAAASIEEEGEEQAGCADAPLSAAEVVQLLCTPQQRRPAPRRLTPPAAAAGSPITPSPAAERPPSPAAGRPPSPSSSDDDATQPPPPAPSQDDLYADPAPAPASLWRLPAGRPSDGLRARPPPAAELLSAPDRLYTEPPTERPPAPDGLYTEPPGVSAALPPPPPAAEPLPTPEGLYTDPPTERRPAPAAESLPTPDGLYADPSGGLCAALPPAAERRPAPEAESDGLFTDTPGSVCAAAERRPAAAVLPSPDDLYADAAPAERLRPAYDARAAPPSPGGLCAELAPVTVKWRPPTPPKRGRAADSALAKRLRDCGKRRRRLRPPATPPHVTLQFRR